MNKLFSATVVAVVVAGAGLSGCATITRGTTTDFVVETDPAGAAVETTTGFSCKSTPCTIVHPRKDAFEVTVSKPGYQTVTQRIETKVAGGGAAGMAGNVVIGGLVGIAIDATSGATKDLEPNPLKITLTPAP